jgi:ADP-ribose pyrophosphatase YjhB (NUDIX family)
LFYLPHDLFKDLYANSAYDILKVGRAENCMGKVQEYILENGEKVDLKKLESDFMPESDYISAHKGLVISCHDVFIQHEDGLLLVVRDNFPMKGELWPIGGRIERGIKTEESLKNKTRKECGLDLHNIKYLGSARILMDTEPFNHGKGTDCVAFVYFARGEGELNLDSLHKNPRIVKTSEYRELRSDLHPYVRDFMDEAIKLI